MLLLVAGLLCGYWWLYRLAPARRTLSLDWRLAHSEQEYWREAQQGIRRGEWLHDDGFAVGMYGDKSWAVWIMENVAPGESMDCFGRLCHSATAMSYITNHDGGDNADAWLEWWAKNQSKSQSEWIADGFRQRGLKVDLPPSADQIPALLGLLGQAKSSGSVGAPAHWQYNAFRCLRDSDFDPVAYAIAHRSVPADVQQGLLEYARLQRAWPAANEVGILSFGKTRDESWGSYGPIMLTPKFQIVAYSLVFGPLLLGAGLLAWSFRRNVATDAVDE